MRLFAIGDLHLPGGQEKPMDVFGGHWEGHFERISQDWRNRVGADDVVLIPGDTSWAMQLKDAVPDLAAIGELPGRKLLIRGNHDYWWGGIGQVRKALPEGMMAIQHDAVDLGDVVVTGTRGWAWPTEEAPLSPEDERVFNRELIRLEASLKAAGDREKYCFLHYPPIYQGYRCQEIIDLLERYGVTRCCYGHLHGGSHRLAITGLQGTVDYSLVSADYLGFRPKLLLD